MKPVTKKTNQLEAQPPDVTYFTKPKSYRKPRPLPDRQLVGICTVQRSSEDSSVDVPIKSKFRQLCVSFRSCMRRPCWLSSFKFRFFPEAYRKKREVATKITGGRRQQSLIGTDTTLA